MLKTVNGVVLSGAMAMVMACSLAAQKTPEGAPIPSQIASAKKVFISNTPGDDFESTGPSRLYNAFYAAVNSSGRYELVSSPADADLIFEISFRDPAPAVTVTSGTSHPDPCLRLVIRDPKTMASLWWLTAHVEPYLLRRTGEKNFEHAVADLASQLGKLAATSRSASSGAKAATTQ
jgi:hypothetical protein